MLQFIMDQNLLLYVCGVACALGVISQFLLKHLYGKLISETQGTREKGKFLQQLRLRFQNCTHLNEKVNDIASFTKRSIMDYRFLKMNLHQWWRLGLESLTVCLLCSGAGLWLLYRNGGAISLTTSYAQAGIWSALLLGIAYGLNDNRFQRYSLQIRLMDYLENSGAVRDHGEVEFRDTQASAAAGMPLSGGMRESASGAVSLGTKEAAASVAASVSRLQKKQNREDAAGSRAQREKQELKGSLLRANRSDQETAAAREALLDQEKKKDLLRQMDPKEKEQILREILTEFLT